jgi:hypothetical protein
MERKPLVVPHSIPLTKAEAWEADGDDRKRATKFFRTRWHFVLEKYSPRGDTHRGDLLGTFRSPKGSEQVVCDRIKRSVHSVNLEKTIRASLQASDAVTDLSRLIRETVIGKNLSQVEEAKTGLQARLRASLTPQTFTERVETDESAEEWPINFTIPSEQSQEHHAVTSYQKRPVRIYLAFVDYLLVEYTSSFFGIRRTRKKKPVALGTHKRARANVIEYGFPVADVEIWEHAPNCGLVLRADELRSTPEVPDSSEVTATTPAETRKKPYYLNLWSKEPSLYQVAEAAFPIAWAKRKGEWTPEELFKIETDESKEIESRWLQTA